MQRSEALVSLALWWLKCAEVSLEGEKSRQSVGMQRSEEIDVEKVHIHPVVCLETGMTYG